MVLPNFLLIGAEKAGTTWLYRRLREHPDIFLSSTKEIHYFNRYNSNLEELDFYVEMDEAWYEQFFENHSGESAVGEATPIYLCDQKAPVRIEETLEAPQFLVSLRNPIDRAYSHYWMARRKGHTDRSFPEVVDNEAPRFIERGRYGDQLERYIDRFGADSVCVLLFEELVESPVQGLTDICNFLGVATAPVHRLENPDQKEYGSAEYRSTRLYNAMTSTVQAMRRSTLLSKVVDAAKATGLARWIKTLNRSEADYPPMDEEERKKLRDYYQPTVRKLEGLLDRSLGPWRSKSKPARGER